MVAIYNLHMLVWITTYGVIIHGNVSRLKRTVDSTDTSSIQIDSISKKIYSNDTYTVYKGSRDYARVAKPLLNVKLMKLINFQFEDKNQKIFGITKYGGIVYIKNEQLLQQLIVSHLTLKIIYNKIQKTEITLKLENLTDKPCTSISHCSSLDTKSKCASFCGKGSVSKCQWRETPKPIAFTVDYSTCTPDINTCPDGYCDSLEKINKLICPQDCSEEIFGNGSRDTDGFLIAMGVCTCDEVGSCTCEKKNYNTQTKSDINNKPTTPITSSATSSSTTIIFTPISSTTTRTYTSSSPTTQISNVQDKSIDSIVIISIIIVIAFVTIGILMYCCRKKIVWIFGSIKTIKTNRNVRTLEEFIPSYDRDGYLPNPVPSRDTSTINTEFDPKWEFPRSRLILQKVIGGGEFGKVLKAQAVGISSTKGMITVAVKTIKNDGGQTEKDDLFSEYNLLKDINHPNIVKLLGACTTKDGPFYLIIEYAKHGSLWSYLRKSRILDTNLLDCCFDNNFQHRECEFHPIISPRDILKFACQISKGMSYLADLKLVHRDLAARNVLVTEEKMCKISDFGLTRDVYEDNAYLKKTKGRVPVKWMAPESLADHIYTSRSDVWSFGILLWELVTLGTAPYPGIAVQDLFKLLKGGYRMDKPNNCSNELYEIMKSCWAEDQYRRSSFKSLTMSLEMMLETENDYLQLDFKQIVNNMCYFIDNGETENQITLKSTEDKLKYEIPKSLNEIETLYVTMKDFKFDPVQQAQIV